MKIGPIKIGSREQRRARRRPLPPEFLPPLTPCNIPVQRCPVPREQASQRILIMRAGAFGDILMGTPLLAALRAAYPDAHLTWIVEYTQVEAIDANPYIDEYLRWDGSFWKNMLRRGLYPLWLLRALQMQKVLRGKNYDIFVSFQPEEWPLLLWGVGAAVSVGIFDTFKRFYGASRSLYRQYLYTRAYTDAHLPAHRVDQYLLTLESLGLPQSLPAPMRMGYTQLDRDAAENFLFSHGIAPGETFAALAPMTTWPTKCWPSENFVALGDALVRRHGCRCLLFGSGQERSTLTGIAAKMEAAPVVMAGELGFREMAALLDRAALLVSGDTGPMHVASALGTPQVALFGPTSPDWYGPRSGKALSLIHPVPCGPCDKKVCRNTEDPHLCMRLLSVEEVLEKAGTLLARLGAVA